MKIILALLWSEGEENFVSLLFVVGCNIEIGNRNTSRIVRIYEIFRNLSSIRIS